MPSNSSNSGSASSNRSNPSDNDLAPDHIAAAVSSQEESSDVVSLPSGVDPEVFAALPPELRQEVLRGHASPESNELQDQLPPGHDIDLDVFNALPIHLQQDIIAEQQRQVGRNGRSSNAGRSVLARRLTSAANGLSPSPRIFGGSPRRVALGRPLSSARRRMLNAFRRSRLSSSSRSGSSKIYALGVLEDYLGGVTRTLQLVSSGQMEVPDDILLGRCTNSLPLMRHILNMIETTDEKDNAVNPFNMPHVSENSTKCIMKVFSALCSEAPMRLNIVKTLIARCISSMHSAEASTRGAEDTAKNNLDETGSSKQAQACGRLLSAFCRLLRVDARLVGSLLKGNDLGAHEGQVSSQSPSPELSINMKSKIKKPTSNILSSSGAASVSDSFNVVDHSSDSNHNQKHPLLQLLGLLSPEMNNQNMSRRTRLALLMSVFSATEPFVVARGAHTQGALRLKNTRSPNSTTNAGAPSDSSTKDSAIRISVWLATTAPSCAADSAMARLVRASLCCPS